MKSFAQRQLHGQLNEKGFAVLPFSLIVSVIIAAIFMYVSDKSEKLISRYYISQGQSYALDLAPKLAMKIRWSYDIAKAEMTPPGLPNFCSSQGTGFSIVTINSIPLCLNNSQICVSHPRDAHPVCIGTADASLLANISSEPDILKKTLIAQLATILINRAEAASAPAAPPAGETANLISGTPVCIGLNDCGATCSAPGLPGGTADCITFKFCSLTTQCRPDQWVWQTIALLK